MNQITWQQAEEIAAKAAIQALGFGPRGDKVVKITAAEMEEVGRKAAVIALRQTGCLAANDAREERTMDRLAKEANSRHAAWCKATGNNF